MDSSYWGCSPKKRHTESENFPTFPALKPEIEIEIWRVHRIEQSNSYQMRWHAEHGYEPFGTEYDHTAYVFWRKFGKPSELDKEQGYPEYESHSISGSPTWESQT